MHGPMNIKSISLPTI